MTTHGHTTPDLPFVEYRKVPRLNRVAIVTEKIDGCTGRVIITADGKHAYAASRYRWQTIDNDMYGFAQWVADHHDELLPMGPGEHAGEWWGHKIQRTYGLTERRFSLFNVRRWGDDAPRIDEETGIAWAARPACCRVVPVIARGVFMDLDLRAIIEHLRATGSVAEPGWPSPEGIIVTHVDRHADGKREFKYTIDGGRGTEDAHKSAR